MTSRLHEALRTTVVATTHMPQGRVTVVDLQRSKDDIHRTAHVAQTTWGISGAFSLGDLLLLLGFDHGRCAFDVSSECFARLVSHDFDAEGFSKATTSALEHMKKAETELEKCGFYLPHPTRRARVEPGPLGRHAGDGHTSPQVEEMKGTEDEHFRYKLTWLEGGRAKGWTIHYLTKAAPEPEFGQALSFLGLSRHKTCPENDFEPCVYRHIGFEEGGHHFFDSNAELAHRWFDAHEASFLPGLRALIHANTALQTSGFTLLQG